MSKTEDKRSFQQFRERFFIDDPELVYLDGNSLGRLPIATIHTMREVVETQWGRGLIRSWNDHWLGMVLRVRQKIAALIGADVEEVLVADSTSVNLFKLVQACLSSGNGSGDVVTDNANFPSDLYILDGVCRRTESRARLKVVDVNSAELDQIEVQLLHSITESTKLVVLSHVHYQSGYAYQLQNVNRVARQVDAKVIWDVSHSIGAMPIDVRASGCDMMVGCCYKYLNGGPGAPAFLYIRRELQSQLRNPIQGWFGAANPFAFSATYEPTLGIEQFAVGTPNVLSLAAIEPGVDLVLEAGIERIRQRSLELTARLIEALDRLPREWGITIASPRRASNRGSHVSIQHENAWQITQALIRDFNVIPDYREPSIIRFGITPLYTNEQEIDRAVEALRAILQERIFLSYSPEKSGVT
jgi:kynureninase